LDDDNHHLNHDHHHEEIFLKPNSKQRYDDGLSYGAENFFMKDEKTTGLFSPVKTSTFS